MSLLCPACRDVALQPELTHEGVEIDRCPSCQGVWLDRGELFLFTDDPQPLQQKLTQALSHPQPGSRRSPRGGEMQAINWPMGPTLDYCPKSGGLWLDLGELEALFKSERRLHLKPDRAATPADAPPPRAQELLPTMARSLPNLLMRSIFTLVGLFALLTAFLIAAVEFGELPLEMAVGIAVGLGVVEFLFSPLLLDWMLRRFFKSRPLEPEQLSPRLRAFIEKTCADNEMPFPRLRLIEDGAPQAFTYGHTPRNARVVVTAGLMELLEPDELEAVVAHELGHAAHWDILLMTVAQLFPIIFYAIFRLLTGGRQRDGRLAMVGMGAWALYFVSQMMVLAFSRIREYHADRFAAETTGNPEALSRALVKIGYGLMGRGVKAPPAAASDDKKKADAPQPSYRNPGFSAFGAMGIFSASHARAMAIAGVSGDADSANAPLDPPSVARAMRWDLWSPWAKLYEWFSTHPLIARRIDALNDFGASLGKPAAFPLDQRQPESYWDEFLVDLLVWALPVLTLICCWFGMPYVANELTEIIAGPLPFDPYFVEEWTDQMHAANQTYWAVGEGLNVLLVGISILLFALARTLKLRFRYPRRKGYPEASVAALLKRVKTSDVRAIPCTLRGVVIGRGQPGFILSEDFILRDETGIIYLDYRQPLALWEALFALLKRDRYTGKTVEIEGWYRRAPIPYVELRQIRCEGEKTRTSWSYRLKLIFNWLIVVVGVLIAAVGGVVLAGSLM
ncbi:M48 family metalloprotease [Magnetofaba australis]|nr:M48 family metalloprotease [Magnetofaba australis]